MKNLGIMRDHELQRGFGSGVWDLGGSCSSELWELHVEIRTRVPSKFGLRRFFRNPSVPCKLG